MLEYFTYKKVKKHQVEKKAHENKQLPLLDEDDERFLTRVVSAESTPPPLPERPYGLVVEAGNSSQAVVHDGGDSSVKDNDIEKPNKNAKKANRFSFLLRHGTKKDKNLTPNKVISPEEEVKEADEINKVLDDLNLAAVNNRAFSISKESQEVVQKFTIILKDLINGVPTAYDDLVHLLDDSQGTLAKSYDHLPSFLQKLITQLPTKLTGSLAPELLAVASEAQALRGGDVAGATTAGGLGGAAKNFLKISSLKDLVTKPGTVVSMLKAIMNALKLRWPAFMGTNVLLSLGLFVLLFVFWYCHKRGRETRLEREKTVDSNGRIIDLDDDPMLDSPGPSRGHSQRKLDRQHRHDRSDPSPHSNYEEGRREHTSRRDHTDRSGASTPSRSHRERRPPGSSRRQSSEHGGR